MNINRSGGLAAALSAALFLGGAGSATAQERTIGAAHDFIRDMFNDRPEQVTVTRYQPGVAESHDSSTTEARYAYLRLGDCNASVSTHARNSGSLVTRIDWSTVGQVDRSQTNRVFVRLYGGNPDFRMIGFTMPSEADAARVETAMEFLRRNCAPASAF